MTAQQITMQYPDLPGFDNRARRLVYAMMDSGWTGRVTSKGHFLGKAPDGHATTTVPSKMNSRGRGGANAEAIFTRWLRNSAPESVRTAMDALSDNFDELDEIILAGAASKAANALGHNSIVMVRPWMARKGGPKASGGVTYASQAVLERQWSHGETDYLCTRCDYTNTNPRGVATHYGHKHTMKGAPAASQDGPVAIDPEYTEASKATYTPTDRLIAALVAALDDAIENGTDRLDVARRLLTWLHDRPDIEHHERDYAPLDDADILNRIRLLVGQPDQSERIAQLTAERDEANAHLVKVQRDLDGIKELMEGVGR